MRLNTVKKQIKGIVRHFYYRCIQFAYLLPIGKLPKHAKRAEYDIPDGAVVLDAKILPVRDDKQGIVTIVSDDGVYSTAKQLDLLSKKYGIPITVAGTVWTVFPHILFWKRQKDLLELVNHSYNHVRMDEASQISADRKSLTHEIIHSKTFFEKVTGKRNIVFVCPENQMCMEGYDLLSRSGYVGVARGTRGFNELSPVINARGGYSPGSLFNLKRMGIRDEADEQGRNKWIDQAISGSKWLIEMWHNVDNNTEKGYQTISVAEASQHIEYIKANEDKIWVANLSDAIKYIWARDNSIVKAYYYNGEIYSFLQTNEDYDWIADFELTIKIDLTSIPKSTETELIKNLKIGQIVHWHV